MPSSRLGLGQYVYRNASLAVFVSLPLVKSVSSSLRGSACASEATCTCPDRFVCPDAILD